MTNDSLFNIIARLKTLMLIDAADSMHNEIGSIIADMNAALSDSGAFGNMAKAMKAVLKRTKYDVRQVLAYSNINKHGQQEVCDGYMMIRSKTIYEAVPVLPADIGEYIDTDKIMTDAVLNSPYKLITPTMAELKQYIADYKSRMEKFYGDKPTAKAMERLLYRLPSVEKREDNPYVNVKLLMNILEAFPSAEVAYTDPVKPIVFKSDDGDGLLLPVRVNFEHTSPDMQYVDEVYEEKCKALYADKPSAEPIKDLPNITDIMERIKKDAPITLEEFETLIELHIITPAA